MGIYIDLDFYEIDATNVKTIAGILWLDNSTMIFVTPERATVINNIPDPKKSPEICRMRLKDLEKQ